MSLRRPRTIAALLPPRDADAPALGAGAPARANSWSDAAPTSGATHSRYRLASLSGGARVPSIDLTSLSNNGVLDMGLMDSSSSDDEASSHDGRSVFAMSSGSFGSHGSASSAAAATPGEGVPTTSPSSAAAASLGAPAERPASAPRHRRATRGSSGKDFGGGAAAAASVDVSPDGWQAPADGDVDDAPELQALVSRLVRVRPHVPAVDGAAVNATTTGGGEVAFDERGRVCVRFPYRNPIVVPGNHNISPALDNEAVYTRYLNRYADNLLDRYNVTVMAHGETGSGKTHTMQSAVRRFAKDIAAAALASRTCHSPCLQVQVVEVYTDRVYDLLADTAERTTIRVGHSGHPEAASLSTIFDQGDGDTSLDLAAIDRRLNAVFTAAELRRTAAPHVSNATSSRSHAVYYLHLTFSERDPRGVSHRVTTTLTAFDLAGCEGLAVHELSPDHPLYGKRGDSEARKREQRAINRDLTALQTMMTQVCKLGDPSRANFRDTTLNRMLMPTLLGGARLVLVATLGPVASKSVSTTAALMQTAGQMQPRPLQRVAARRTNDDVRDALQAQLAPQPRTMKGSRSARQLVGGGDDDGGQTEGAASDMDMLQAEVAARRKELETVEAELQQRQGTAHGRSHAPDRTVFDPARRESITSPLAANPMTRRPKHGRRSSITSPPRGLAEHTDLGRSTPSSLSPPDRQGEHRDPRDKAAARLRHRHEAAKQALEEAQAKVLGSNADLSSQLDLILDMGGDGHSGTRSTAAPTLRNPPPPSSTQMSPTTAHSTPTAGGGAPSSGGGAGTKAGPRDPARAKKRTSAKRPTHGSPVRALGPSGATATPKTGSQVPAPPPPAPTLPLSDGRKLEVTQAIGARLEAATAQLSQAGREAEAGARQAAEAPPLPARRGRSRAGSVTSTGSSGSLSSGSQSSGNPAPVSARGASAKAAPYAHAAASVGEFRQLMALTQTSMLRVTTATPRQCGTQGQTAQQGTPASSTPATAVPGSVAKGAGATAFPLTSGAGGGTAGRPPMTPRRSRRQHKAGALAPLVVPGDSKPDPSADSQGTSGNTHPQVHVPPSPAGSQRSVGTEARDQDRSSDGTPPNRGGGTGTPPSSTDPLQEEVNDKLQQLRELQAKINSAAESRQDNDTGPRGAHTDADAALKAAQALMIELVGLHRRMAADLQDQVAMAASADQGTDERKNGNGARGSGNSQAEGSNIRPGNGVEGSSDDGSGDEGRSRTQGRRGGRSKGSHPRGPPGRASKNGGGPQPDSPTAEALRLLEWLDQQMRQMPYTTLTIAERVSDDDVLHAAFCAKGGIALLVRDLDNTSYISATVEGIEKMCRDTGAVDPARGHGTVSSFAMHGGVRPLMEVLKRVKLQPASDGLSRAVLRAVAALCARSPFIGTDFLEAGITDHMCTLLERSAPIVGREVCITLVPFITRLSDAASRALTGALSGMFASLKTFRRCLGDDNELHRALATATAVVLQRCGRMHTARTKYKADISEALEWLVYLLVHPDHVKDLLLRQIVTRAMAFAVLGNDRMFRLLHQHLEATFEQQATPLPANLMNRAFDPNAAHVVVMEAVADMAASDALRDRSNMRYDDRARVSRPTREGAVLARSGVAYAGRWTHDTAGGIRCRGATFLRNPQYTFTVEEACDVVVVLRKALDDTLTGADPSCQLPPEPSPKAHCDVVVAADATDTADGGLTHVSRVEFQRRPNLHPVFQGGRVRPCTSVFHMRADPGRVYTLTPAHDKPGRELMYGLSIFASTSTLHCEELGSLMPGWHLSKAWEWEWGDMRRSVCGCSSMPDGPQFMIANTNEPEVRSPRESGSDSDNSEGDDEQLADSTRVTVLVAPADADSTEVKALDGINRYYAVSILHVPPSDGDGDAMLTTNVSFDPKVLLWRRDSAVVTNPNTYRSLGDSFLVSFDAQPGCKYLVVPKIMRSDTETEAFRRHQRLDVDDVDSSDAFPGCPGAPDSVAFVVQAFSDRQGITLAPLQPSSGAFHATSRGYSIDPAPERVAHVVGAHESGEAKVDAAAHERQMEALEQRLHEALRQVAQLQESLESEKRGRRADVQRLSREVATAQREIVKLKKTQSV